MKKRILVMMMLIFAILSGSQADAKIWRVNKTSNYIASNPTNYGGNVGGTFSYPVFKEINQAVEYSEVDDGDTLHVEGYSGLYNFSNLTKRLVIIGPGYFLNQNPNVSTNVEEANMYGIELNASSAGTQLIGLNISYSVTIWASDIVIKRCFLEPGIYISGDALSNIQILQNYFDNAPPNYSVSAVNVGPSNIPPTDLIFNNNICERALRSIGSAGPMFFIECNNNVFDFPSFSSGEAIKINTSSFQNNILKTANATVNINGGTNNTVDYCISSSATGQFGTAINNVVVTDMSTLFVNPATNSTDGDYQLLAGSPGSNNGSDGTDRGAFGGLSPTRRYTLSGLGPIPVIYQISTSGVATPSGLSVTIKARTIK